MWNSTTARSALAGLVLAGSGCSDGTGLSGRIVDEAEIVAQCSEGTIADATTAQMLSGTLDGSDCRIRGDDGWLEGYRVPQSAFGSMTEISIDLEAAFDAVIVVTRPDGTHITYSDQDIGGDLGREQIVLPADLDPARPEYFVVVYDLFGESGDYTLTVGPVP